MEINVNCGHNKSQKNELHWGGKDGTFTSVVFNREKC